MRAVLIGIGKNYYFMVIEVCDIEIVADTRSERAYYRTNFLVFKHLFYSLLFGVKRFASQRQNSLMLPVSALLRAAACRVALYDKYFVEFGFFTRTGSEFADKFRAVRSALCSRDFLCVSRGVSRLSRSDSLSYHRVEYLLILLVFNEFVEFFDRRAFNRAFRFGVSEFSLSLSFEFDVFHFYGNNSRHSLSEIFARKNKIFSLTRLFDFA